MFRALVQTQYPVVIKCFRCDLEEYIIITFVTPKQNGVAERKHMHIMKTNRFLLLFVSVPGEF